MSLVRVAVGEQQRKRAPTCGFVYDMAPYEQW